VNLIILIKQNQTLGEKGIAVKMVTIRKYMLAALRNWIIRLFGNHV